MSDIAHDLALIATQENTLRLPHFDENVAWQLGGMLHRLASARSLAITIDVRTFERTLFTAALPGSVPDQADWIRRKSNVVKRFHRSSYALGLELKAAGRSLEDRYGAQAAADYAVHGGAFPLHVASAGVIGAVTVSGLAQR